MKGLCLSLLSCIFLFLLSLVLLRVYQGKKYFKVLLTAYVLSLPFYFLLWKITPQNLGFLTPSFLEPHSKIDFCNGLILLTLIFHSFWDFCYATAFTGFSSNLLVLLQKKESLTLSEILKIYGEEGEQGILSWRLPNLIKGNYLTEKDGRLYLGLKGMLIARLTLGLKRLFALPY